MARTLQEAKLIAGFFKDKAKKRQRETGSYACEHSTDIRHSECSKCLEQLRQTLKVESKPVPKPIPKPKAVLKSFAEIKAEKKAEPDLNAVARRARASVKKATAKKAASKKKSGRK